MSKVRIVIEIDADAFTITAESNGQTCTSGMARFDRGWKGTRKQALVEKERSKVFGGGDEIDEAIDDLESAAMNIAEVIANS